MRDVAALMGLFAGTAALSACLIMLLMPLLQRYALARPSARSSHTVPTPQGAGLAVIAAMLAGTIAAVFLTGAISRPSGATASLLALVLAVLGLATIGFADDVSPLPPRLRLAVQALAAMALVFALPGGSRALPLLPYALEALIWVVGLVWFINLTNFMDGIDGMTVAGIVPVLAGAAILATTNASASNLDTIVAVALAGALIGFAPFNRHVARVFLGDVGSLAIGGITGWLLLSLACSGRLAAALILPLYYIADTGVTLFRRWHRGDNLASAHREHFYQRALSNGLSVPQAVARVWLLNGALVAIALAAGSTANLSLQLACLLVAAGLTIMVLRTFAGTGQP
jgi:UDP-N-acetylmuramyl pentapeptide phosphotransferase/UDP-N-acetylglucosamine-1-phosphate transferase